MRTVLLAILISMVAVGETVAMDAMWGRVVSIDHPGHEMVVRARPMTDIAGKSDNDDALSEGREVTVKFDGTRLPPCVTEGTVVRLWGAFSRKEPDVFNATFIRGAGRRSWRYDPTGVRQRIGLGHGPGSGPPGRHRAGRSCSIPGKP